VPALTLENLVVRYGAITAVAGLSLVAEAGTVTALIGPNGAGKTSTVEVCAGLRTATTGQVTVLGTRLPAAGAPAASLHDRVGVMLQDGGLYTSAAPLELVTYIASLYRRPDDPRRLLESVGIDPGTRTAIRRLSGGEQQRVKCALALVGQPDLVFLDEPTAGLDPLARRGIHDLVRGLTDRGCTVVLTTHLMDDVERLADQVVVVARGRALRTGTVHELVGDDDTITFRGPLHVDVTDLRAALPADYSVTEDHPGHYRVVGAAEPMVLSAIASWSAQHGSPMAELSVGRRSLEDVVIDLIGEQP